MDSFSVVYFDIGDTLATTRFVEIRVVLDLFDYVGPILH
jgi:hypothetical protein